MKLSDYFKSIGKPFSYYPELAKVIGSVKASVLLCSLVWRDREFQDGVVQKTEKQIEDETGLGPKEVKSAKKLLSELRVLKVVHHRLDHVTDLEVDFDRLEEILTVPREVPKRHFGGVRNGSSRSTESASRSLSLELSKRIKERSNPPSPSKCFIPPTESEVLAYMVEQQLKNPEDEAKAFLDHHETRGWIPSGQRTQMKSWKAAVRTWKHFQNQRGERNGFRNKDAERAEYTRQSLKPFVEAHSDVAGNLFGEHPSARGPDGS